ncbi:energy-coupling factor ABC transporter ATP-binding protein [Saccharomonospora saliphila]|uniref:energy-coupling factor ABC transporter ATP-binding protein n=1 Tax=Saccharomonospora saliphila TaxID=369829 RepID=UPI0006627CE4|nr:ABC transporter ATP-binding protein [Saccharomonospora saliphila]
MDHGDPGTAGTHAPGAPPALDVADLRHRYPDGRLALAGVDLRVDAGQRVAVLGPNGAGKTTLALHLNGLLTPSAGTVRVAGIEVAPPTFGEIRRRVGLVFQDPDDQLFMPTVAEDVAFGPRNFGVAEPELSARVRAALDAVGMAGHARRPPSRLSVGQRRRVALATVLASAPDVLVLDEPSVNLEPVARRELVEVLATLTATMLVVTHDLPFALQLCPRGVLLDDGVVIADRPTRALLADEALLAAHRLELPWGFRLDPG